MTTSAVTHFRIGDPMTTDCSEMIEQGGQLASRLRSGAATYDLPTVTYDPVAQRFLRMRELNGTCTSRFRPTT